MMLCIILLILVMICVLSPSPVISSANTFDGSNGSALGEVGGQGQVSLNGKKRNFTAPCHGVYFWLFSMLFLVGVIKRCF